jgi:hypothetical protein
VIKSDKFIWLLGLVLTSLIGSANQDVSAGELSSFNEQVASAYAPYRSAMFYLRTGNPGVAVLDLDAASRAWQSVVARFGEAPPDAYADDEDFGDRLKSVQQALDSGQSLLDGADRTAAMEVLTPVRMELAALRRRSGIRVYSDCIDEMNAAMDRLWQYRQEPPNFDQPDQVNAVKRDTAVAEYLYRRCYETAPVAYQSDEAFRRMFEGSLASLPLIFDALDQVNEAMLINILRELRSFDRMIWLQYG